MECVLIVSQELTVAASDLSHLPGTSRNLRSRSRVRVKFRALGRLRERLVRPILRPNRPRNLLELYTYSTFVVQVGLLVVVVTNATVTGRPAPTTRRAHRARSD
ncbi:hypothetical protein EVAR_18312_1 [Eumeta japonica]|uniref:Uncharacterized protein n=1 Tax=Eumeta variegata TaxID=151549 RepID=A0A4C1VA80_EUMVA|nr:hypothetical protein EVAR_18312_1 [Eumeta japonica]